MSPHVPASSRDGFEDLKEKTELIFEEFRRGRLEASGVRDAPMQSDDNFHETLAAERLAWEEKSKRDEEELQSKFKRMMEEKEEEFKRKEADVGVSFPLPLFFVVNFTLISLPGPDPN